MSLSFARRGPAPVIKAGGTPGRPVAFLDGRLDVEQVGDALLDDAASRARRRARVALRVDDVVLDDVEDLVDDEPDAAPSLARRRPPAARSSLGALEPAGDAERLRRSDRAAGSRRGTARPRCSAGPLDDVAANSSSRATSESGIAIALARRRGSTSSVVVLVAALLGLRRAPLGGRRSRTLARRRRRAGRARARRGSARPAVAHDRGAGERRRCP